MPVAGTSVGGTVFATVACRVDAGVRQKSTFMVTSTKSISLDDPVSSMKGPGKKCE